MPVGISGLCWRPILGQLLKTLPAADEGELLHQLGLGQALVTPRRRSKVAAYCFFNATAIAASTFRAAKPKADVQEPPLS